MLENIVSWSNLISLGIGVLISSIVWYIKTISSAKINTSFSDSSSMKKDKIKVDRDLYAEFIKDYPTQSIESLLTKWHNVICKEEELDLIASIKRVWTLPDKRFHDKKIQKKLELVINDSYGLFECISNIVEQHFFRFDLYIIPYMRKATKPDLCHQQISEIRKHIDDFSKSYNDFIYVTRDTLKC